MLGRLEARHGFCGTLEESLTSSPRTQGSDASSKVSLLSTINSDSSRVPDVPKPDIVDVFPSAVALLDNRNRQKLQKDQFNSNLIQLFPFPAAAKKSTTKPTTTRLGREADDHTQFEESRPSDTYQNRDEKPKATKEAEITLAQATIDQSQIRDHTMRCERHNEDTKSMTKLEKITLEREATDMLSPPLFPDKGAPKLEIEANVPRSEQQQERDAITNISSHSKITETTSPSSGSTKDFSSAERGAITTERDAITNISSHSKITETKSPPSDPTKDSSSEEKRPDRTKESLASGLDVLPDMKPSSHTNDREHLRDPPSREHGDRNNSSFLPDSWGQVSTQIAPLIPQCLLTLLHYLFLLQLPNLTQWALTSTSLPATPELLERYSTLLTKTRLNRCIHKLESKRDKKGAPPASLDVRRIPIQAKRDKIYFPVRIDNMPSMDAFLDTGAEICVMSENVFVALADHEKYPDARLQTTIKAVNGGFLQQTRPIKLLPLDVGGKVSHHPVAIIAQPDEFITGLCFMKQAKINLLHTEDEELELVVGDYRTSTVRIKPLEKPSRAVRTFDAPTKPIDKTSWEHGNPRSCRATSQSVIAVELWSDGSSKIPAGELLHVPYRLVDDSGEFLRLTANVVVHSEPHQPPCSILPGSYTTQEGRGNLWLRNNGYRDIHLDRSTYLGLATILPKAGLPPGLTSPEQILSEIQSQFHFPTDGHRVSSLHRSFSPLEAPPLETETDIEPEGEQLPSESEEINYRQDILNHPTFPDRLKQPFLNFLDEEVSGLCSRNETDYGCLNMDYEFDIELKDETKLPSARPYKLNDIREQQLLKALGQLQETDILERGDSPSTSAAFIIPKASDKSGLRKTRVIFDYRNLNANTKRLSHPIPHIPTMLQKMVGAKFFTSLDLRGAFHNLRMSKRAQELAAVITPDGIYKPKRLVFGLMNAPPAFSYVMDKILAGVSSCLFYIDDIIIYTREDDEEKHFEDVKRVLRVLHRYNLKINVLKGEYFARKLNFLGKQLDSEGIRPLDRHVEAIKNFPRPTTKKLLQRFLGLLAFSCVFIKDYAKRIEPLSKLLRNQAYSWTDEQETAFVSLRNALTSQSKLYHPDYDAPVYLATDVCDLGFGGILYQVRSYGKEDVASLQQEVAGQDWPALPPQTQHPVFPPTGKQVPPALDLSTIGVTTSRPQDPQVHVVRPIGYMSGVFRGPAENYTVLEKEASAIIKAITHFQHYLYCAPKCYVLTDSQSFCWAMRFRSLGISRLERICIKLMSVPYKIIITHTKGAFQPADNLTRIYKVEDPPKHAQVSNHDAKRAVVVSTPFPVGSVVSAEDILKALQRQPDHVHIPPRDTIPTPALSVTEVSRLSVAQPLSLLAAEIKSTRIQTEQRKEPGIAQIIQSLQNGVEYKRYSLSQGLLYRHDDSSNPEDGRIVLPRVLVPFVLAYYHYQNHSGYKPLLRMIQTDFFIPQLEALASAFTRNCHLCVQHKASTGPKTPFGHILLPSRKIRHWMMDFVVGLPPSNGFDSYWSAIDLFSGFRLAVPVSSTITAKKTVDLVHKHILMHYGIPEALSSDRGPQLLVSNEFKAFTSFYGIKTHVSAAYSPQSHGIVEISNRQISELLRILSDQHSVPWPQLLAYAVHSLNARPYFRLAGLSPFEILFGTKARPLAEILDLTSQPPSLVDNAAVFAALNDRLLGILQTAERDKIHAARAKRPHARRRAFQPNDLVLLRDHRKLDHKKFKPRYHPAPMLVLQDFGESILIQNHLGQTDLVSKSHARSCPSRSAELFGRLPPIVRGGLGFSLDPPVYAEFIKSGTLPKDFTTTLPTNTSGPFQGTRSHTVNPDVEDFSAYFLDEDPELPEHDDPSSDSASDEETNIPVKTPSKIMFRL